MNIKLDSCYLQFTR